MDRSFLMRVTLFIALNCFTVRVSCEQGRCRGRGRSCNGQFTDAKAVCRGGYCYCTGKDYDYNTCLPDAYGCKIVTNADTILGIPRNATGTVDTIYSCCPENSSPQYEVHVLAVYEANRGGSSHAGIVTVNIISGGTSNRPVVLVLVNNEPVKWILIIPFHITISKVILVSYYILKSSVTGDVSRVKSIERIKTGNSAWSTGFGSDSRDRSTVKTLKEIHKWFGVVTSFRGTYRTNRWLLGLSPLNHSANNDTDPTALVLPMVSLTAYRKKCRSGYICDWRSGDMEAFCKDGYCHCNGVDYDYDTCLPDAYGCKIAADLDIAQGLPRSAAVTDGTIYSCSPDNSSSQYEVHVLAVRQPMYRIPPDADVVKVDIISGGKSNRPIVLVLVNYEPVKWILNIPLDITISKVILVSYHILESFVGGDLSRVQDIELIGTSSSVWNTGYGDKGGTVNILKEIHKLFGVVTSFRGTYKTEQWTLQLSLFNGTVDNEDTAVLPKVSLTAHRKECWGDHCFGQSGNMNSFCNGWYCYCNGIDYNYYTCLPDAYGCKIASNYDGTYTCTPHNSSRHYEVHVLAVYEVTNRRSEEVGDMRVDIIHRGKSDNRRLVLVLVSYESVNWILNIPPEITINEVILVSNNIDESSVSGDSSRVQIVERKGTSNSDWNFGYGSFSSGGKTVQLLKQIHKRFGVVTSFTGMEQADRRSLELSPFHGTLESGISAASAFFPIVAVKGDRKKCLDGYCSGESSDMRSFCRDEYCYCNGKDYDYYTCLPDACGCKIVTYSTERTDGPIYYCFPDNSSLQYEVHVMAVYGRKIRLVLNLGSIGVNIISRGKYSRPFILVLVNYESVDWVLSIPKDITISKVILVSRHASSVSGGSGQIENIERIRTPDSVWSTGYGNDSDGGRTVDLLREIHKWFGVVTSFRGTYRTDSWSLDLSKFKRPLNNNSKSRKAVIPMVSKTAQNKKCLGSHCSGLFGDTLCREGHCYCDGTKYDYHSCLPNAYGCKIVADADIPLGIRNYTTITDATVYSCSPKRSSSQYEIHVLAVYEATKGHVQRAKKVTVNTVIRGKSNRPIVLVLSSYKSVEWILNIPNDIIISKVILVSYYIDECSVSGDSSQVEDIERKGTRESRWVSGYGRDTDDGLTVELLKQIYQRFGVVTSFKGAYRRNRWLLELSASNQTFDNGTSENTDILPWTSTTSPTKQCFRGSCPGQFGDMRAFCKDEICYCNGTGYDYYTCLPDAFGCKIVSHSDKTYTCTPDNSSPLYEVHVLAVYEVISRRPPKAGDANVNIISDRKSNRSVVLVLVSYEPVNWILNISADITINEVILVSYSIDESSINGDLSRVKIRERKGTRSSDWHFGYGSDSVVGETVELLRQINKQYGVVTSFRGSYRKNHWSLELSSFQESGNNASQNDKPAKKHEQSSINMTVVGLPVAIIVVTMIVVIVLATLRVRNRRRKQSRSQTMESNQRKLGGRSRNFEENLRMLYPEYYHDDATINQEALKSWEINRARLAVLDNVLGGGSFGFVKEGVLTESLSAPNQNISQSVAVKTLKANHGQNEWNELLTEFEILKYVNSSRHQNIIKLIGACTREVPFLLVMEFCTGGNLKDLLRNSRVSEEYKNIYSNLTERQLINFAAEIARGMQFLFEKKVVHRDIASRNILMNDQLVPKIADFGLARKIDVTAHYIVKKNRLLPVKWMSIESLGKGCFTAASDTWSYGILLWEICTLAEEPYPDVSPYEMLHYLQEGNRMDRPEHCSNEIFAIMERCWQEDPEERPGFDHIYNLLENMLTHNERSYINLRPYHDINETMISQSRGVFPELRREGESCV